MSDYNSTKAKLTATLLTAIGVAIAQPLVGTDTSAQGAPALKKVRIAVATTVLGVSYPWLNLPVALGYWKEEGYDVEVMPVGASLQVVQQMVGRNAEIGQINSSVVVQANVVNNIPVRVVMMNGVIDTAISVPKDSSIREVKDLKGKAIGVFSLASGAIPLLKSYLRENGLDPDKDVSLIPVGLGAPVVDALRTNKVQALVYWGSANANLENAGLELRYLANSAWKQIPDFSLVALQPTIAANPEMVVAIARGAAKASVFAMANPDCVRKIQWANFPKTKPTGADEATLAQWDLRSLNAQLDTMKQAYELGGKVWGQGSAADYARMQDFMVETKQIDKKVDPATFMNDIPDFTKRVNDFDHEAIVRQAQACPVS
jgi:NitT/TauT family transport system substrate-binding protein